MADRDSTDVLVIGGGPAGAASAIYMAQKGYSVTLLDQAWFPRDKVCGEFISPAADPILQKIGVLEPIERLNPVRLKGVAISSYGKCGFAVDYPATEEGRAMTSLSVPRFTLDGLLMQRVGEAGVRVREGFKATEFLLDSGRVTGVSGRDGENAPFTLRAKVVVDAGGRNALSLRRFHLKKKGKRGGKIALAAHWQGAAAVKDYCYMHISTPGYTGMAATGKEEANIVLVVDRICLEGEVPHDFYVRTVLGNPLRRGLLEGAEVMEKVRTVDSLEYSVRSPRPGGLVLVGDATGFIDPFTGEGIYLSLKSAQIASGVLDAALRQGNVSRRHLASYDRLRRREFDRKFLLSRMLQWLIHHPLWCDRVVETLKHHPDLAGTLVGVIGDYVPAGRVVSMKFLFTLLTRGVRPLRCLSPPGRAGARSRL